MCFRFAVLLALLISFAAAGDVDLISNGFRSSNLSLDGIAEFTSNGLLKLTNETRQQKGHAFYPNPVNFKNSTNGSVFTFSTTFVFAIIPEYPNLSGHGIAFVIAPTRGLPGALPSQFLGLFNESNNGNATNHVVAVELDTIQSNEFADINDNHVGIDINGLKSDKSFPAGYYEDGTRQFRNLTLISGQRMQVWVEYHGLEKRMDVTLAPINVPKPKTPLLSLSRDLSSILNNEMYVGFSSSTGSVLTSHYVLGWSFSINGQAQELTLSQLPKLPRLGPKKRSRFLTIGFPLILVSLVLAAVSGDILEAKDPKLGTEYVAEEVELVLKLGLLCSHSEPEARPTMRQCVQFLEGDIPLPEISSLTLSSGGLAFAHREGFDDFAMSYTSSIYKGFSQSSSVAESLLSGGR
ncbi:hypothetical protein QUC31_011331 [Theobroma cacao]